MRRRTASRKEAPRTNRFYGDSCGGRHVWSSESSFHGELVTAPDVGFTVHYAKQNVTSSHFARPGSSLKATYNCGPASCEGGRGLPCPLRSARRAGGGAGAARAAGPAAASPVSHGCAGARPESAVRGSGAALRRQRPGQARPHTAVPGRCAGAPGTHSCPGHDVRVTSPGRPQGGALRALPPSHSLLAPWHCPNITLASSPLPAPPLAQGPWGIFLRAGARREQRAYTRQTHTGPPQEEEVSPPHTWIG